MEKSVMNNKIFMCLIFCLGLIITGCSKDERAAGKVSKSERASFSERASSVKKSAGATQISGIGYFATDAECNSPGMDADYAVRMTGDIEGCLFTYVDDFDCSPGGTYREEGREYFVGTYKGVYGTFWTTYKFEAKFEGCAENGSYLGPEIFGRCQHPIVAGSGEGVFEGVTGRLDMKDDIEAANYIYRGHFKF